VHLKAIFTGTWAALLCWAAGTQAAPVAADAQSCAAPWLRRAAKEATAVEPADKKYMAMGPIAREWARLGNVTEFLAAIDALASAERADGKTNQNIAAMFRYGGTLELMPRLVRDGQLDEAQRLCGMVRNWTSPHFEASAKQALAQALAAAGKLAEARAIASNATGQAAMNFELSIARGLATAGKTDEALAAAKTLSPVMRPAIYHVIVTGKAQQGDIAGAKRVVQDLPAEARDVGLTLIFSAQLKQRDLTGANETLAAITAVERRERYWLELCHAQLQQGDRVGDDRPVAGTAGFQSPQRRVDQARR
jgi:hypothetical protein